MFRLGTITHVTKNLRPLARHRLVRSAAGRLHFALLTSEAANLRQHRCQQRLRSHRRHFLPKARTQMSI